MFGSWDVVLHYDLGRGLRALPGGDPRRLTTMVQYLTARLGEPASWPRDPETVLLALDRLLERNLLEESSPGPKSIALLLDYAQYGVPSDEAVQRHGAGFIGSGFLRTWETCSFLPGRYDLWVYVSSLTTPGVLGYDTTA